LRHKGRFICLVAVEWKVVGNMVKTPVPIARVIFVDFDIVTRILV
jgi:hypothetical protein